MKYEYDVAVIGGGAAGLTASGMAVNFGAKTLLVEKNKLGGDCTWHGCIPSKTLIHYAKMAHSFQISRSFSSSPNTLFDGKKIFERVRKVREKIYHDADQPSIYQKMGIDVIIGEAAFNDNHTITINTGNQVSKITSKYFFIATGSIPIVPSIAGLDSVVYQTNETIFDLSDLPPKMTIIGGGPVGIEMAQTFQRLGTKISVVDFIDRILTKDDPEYSEILKEKLREEGVSFYLDTRIHQVSKSGGHIIIKIQHGDQNLTLESDSLFIATGRKANLKSLNLDSAGVQYDPEGIHVNTHSRTNIKNIYACGDVTGRYQLTHMSEHMAKVAVTNALLKWPAKIESNHVTWCTFTDPEVAHVGLTAYDLDMKGISYEKYRFPFNKLDRAIVDNESRGMIKVFAKKSGKILGATIIGNRAGDMIGEYALALKNGITLRKISDTIHPYPTYGLGNRRAADQWYVRQQSVGMVKWLKRIFGYHGPLPDLSDPDRIV